MSDGGNACCSRSDATNVYALYAEKQADSVGFDVGSRPGKLETTTFDGYTKQRDRNQRQYRLSHSGTSTVTLMVESMTQKQQEQ